VTVIAVVMVVAMIGVVVPVAVLRVLMGGLGWHAYAAPTALL
jgi:hypothetical protein